MNTRFLYIFMSDSLRPHVLQHSRLPCLSLSPGVCSNSCPLSWWCHSTIKFICLFNFFLSVFYSIQCTSFTTLLKSVPKHFIRFVAIMIFLIFFSNSLFFAYRNVADFCMLTLYPQFYWIHLLVLTGFVELLRFSICMIMLTSNTNNLTSSFVFWMPFTFFFFFRCSG